MRGINRMEKATTMITKWFKRKPNEYANAFKKEASK